LLSATGAGGASRRALGTTVFSGMAAATLLAVFFVPMLYVVFQLLAERFRRVPNPIGSVSNAEASEVQG